MLEREGEQRPVDEREHVLADPLGQRAQARALAADEDDRGETHERPSDALVLEAERAQLLRIEHVAPVDDDAAPHTPPRLGPVEVAELRPLRDEDSSVGAVERVECGGQDPHAVEVGMAVGHGVPRAHLRPLREEASREHEARRLAHIVGAGLERQPEERDSLPSEGSEMALELLDDTPFLELVDLDDRVQQLEAVTRVRGELLERERILRKAGTAEADPGPEEGRADAVVEPDPLRDRQNVGARCLADVRDLVDEARCGSPGTRWPRA